MLIKKTDQSKRNLLKYTACGFFLGALGLPMGWPSKQSAILTNGHKLDSLLSRNMTVIGREYLKQYPEEGSTTSLLNAIQLRISAFNGHPDDLPWAELKQLIKADFQTDEVVYLQGWSLSRTEARLAALSVV